MPDVPGTINYPATLDTVVTLFEATNNAATFVTADTGGATITVVSTAAFPSSGALSIEDEIVYYTGKTLTEFTGCVRGREGTTHVIDAQTWTVQARPAPAPTLDSAKANGHVRTKPVQQQPV